MTELVITDKFRIELFRYGTEEKFIIGERETEMKFFDDVFLKKSYEFMNDFKDNDILVFDEIGNKELHLKGYCKKLISLFKNNRIFAVLKKGGNPIVENLDKLENFEIFDLDKFYE
ncbi:nucleoside-triphosphatase [Parvimonas sp. D9]|uniref:nucleoside-triphosphatase n=1 Tax=Parvimonas sp. D9 TaxID=3110689 RepID=UPI002B45DEDE|nr:nucleoside-triphosphatase [Parvimonas sp. D9]MEB3058527.1 nucleoside-triphosphatase [Parvimonas sp. D9]